MKRWPLITSFVLFIVLCMSVTYWTMQFLKPPVRPVAAPSQAQAVAINLDAAASLFGGRTTTVSVASNFQLKGVVVADHPTESVAILATEGKPAQAVRVNGEAMPGVTVKEVHPQYVLLSEGRTVKRVELQENGKSLGKIDVATNFQAQPAPAFTPMQLMPAPNMPAPTPTPAPTSTFGTNTQPPPQFVPPREALPGGSNFNPLNPAGMPQPIKP